MYPCWFCRTPKRVKPTYSPTVEKSEGGDVEISDKTPAEGDDVTITPVPDKGYKVEDVIVTDKKGNEIPVTKNPDGSFTYEQPDGKVEIEVIFAEK